MSEENKNLLNNDAYGIFNLSLQDEIYAKDLLNGVINEDLESNQESIVPEVQKLQ